MRPLSWPAKCNFLHLRKITEVVLLLGFTADFPELIFSICLLEAGCSRPRFPVRLPQWGEEPNQGPRGCQGRDRSNSWISSGQCSKQGWDQIQSRAGESISRNSQTTGFRAKLAHQESVQWLQTWNPEPNPEESVFLLLIVREPGHLLPSLSFRYGNEDQYTTAESRHIETRAVLLRTRVGSCIACLYLSKPSLTNRQECFIIHR